MFLHAEVGAEDDGQLEERQAEGKDRKETRSFKQVIKFLFARKGKGYHKRLFDYLKKKISDTSGEAEHPGPKLVAVTWNVQHLLTASQDHISKMAIQDRAHVIFLQETKIKTNIAAGPTVAGIVPRGYRAFWSCTKSGKEAGVGTLLRDDISTDKSTTFFASSEETRGRLQIVRLLTENGGVLLVNCYLSSDEKEQNEKIWRKIDAARQCYPTDRVIIGGDYNAVIEDTERKPANMGETDKKFKAEIDKRSLKRIESKKLTTRRYKSGSEVREAWLDGWFSSDRKGTQRTLNENASSDHTPVFLETEIDEMKYNTPEESEMRKALQKSSKETRHEMDRRIKNELGTDRLEGVRERIAEAGVQVGEKGITIAKNANPGQIREIRDELFTWVQSRVATAQKIVDEILEARVYDAKIKPKKQFVPQKLRKAYEDARLKAFQWKQIEKAYLEKGFSAGMKLYEELEQEGKKEEQTPETWENFLQTQIDRAGKYQGIKHKKIYEHIGDKVRLNRKKQKRKKTYNNLFNTRRGSTRLRPGRRTGNNSKRQRKDQRICAQKIRTHVP